MVPCRGDRDPLIMVPCSGDRDPLIMVPCRGDGDPLVTEVKEAPFSKGYATRNAIRSAYLR
jgi:hypothetical protein